MGDLSTKAGVYLVVLSNLLYCFSNVQETSGWSCRIPGGKKIEKLVPKPIKYKIPKRTKVVQLLCKDIRGRDPQAVFTWRRYRIRARVALCQ